MTNDIKIFIEDQKLYRNCMFGCFGAEKKNYLQNKWKKSSIFGEAHQNWKYALVCYLFIFLVIWASTAFVNLKISNIWQSSFRFILFTICKYNFLLHWIVQVFKLAKESNLFAILNLFRKNKPLNFFIGASISIVFFAKNFPLNSNFNMLHFCN